jgi:hypothetical protein
MTKILNDVIIDNKTSARKTINDIKKQLIKKNSITIKIGGEKIKATRDDIYAIQFLVAIGVFSPANIEGLNIREDGLLKSSCGLDSIGNIVSMKLLEMKCK